MKKSYLNALYAILYIVGIVSLMLLKPDNGPEFIAGITVLSLLVLSAAVMGYLFVGTPLMMYLNGEKKEAVRFFLETVFAFGFVAVLLVLIQFVIRFIK